MICKTKQERRVDRTGSIILCHLYGIMGIALLVEQVLKVLYQ